MGLECENSAVKIAVREGPFRDALKETTKASVISYHPNSNILIVDERPFTFDTVLGPSVTQSQVFDDLIKPLVNYFNQGFNCTALAYGQTGTGKSYTMGLDSINFDGEHIGVIPRCLREIFNDTENCETNQESTTDGPFNLRELSASFIEIYNEKVYDLLAENATDPILAKGFRYTGGSRNPINNLEDCYTLLLQGNKNRHVRPTKMNSQSSRSHAIFTIYMRKISRNSNAVKTTVDSCLNMVDLAGSEGVRRTGHQGVAMSEGVNINQGLLSIGKVLQAITLGSKVIPYRDSVLSSVLQDSLNANSYLTLLACISPHREDISETLSTLRFAQNAKQLKNTPQINNIIAEIKKNAKHKQTPYKGKPLQRVTKPKATPFKLPLASKNAVNLKNLVKSNTFCTPKKRHIEINKCNQTDIPEIHKRPKFSNIGMNLPKMEQLNSTNRSSIELNASLSSLNISSSTAIDTAANNQANGLSFSPIIRKCLTEFESGLEKKFVEILQRNMHTLVAPQTPATVIPGQSILPSTMRSEIKTIMKEILAESRTMKEYNIPLQINAKCQLFSDSPELFKIPAVPIRASHPKTSSPNVENEYEISFTENFFNKAAGSEENMLNKSIRRSKRLSQRFVIEKPLDDENNPTLSNAIENKAVRRSTRRSVLEKSIRHSFSAVNVEDKIENNIRKSARRSVLQKKQIKNKKQCHLSCCHSPVPNQKSNSNNSIVQNCYNGSSLSNHRKAVLDLLNKGSRKEVQILPMIGQKRAFQIITHRTLHGIFKNFSQVEKLPFWRGSEWTRFAEANFLV